jgi:hypothetical protein
VLEGTYDTAIFTELLPRVCGADIEIASPIEANGSGRLMKRFPVWLKRFEHITPAGPVDRALVIRDANGRNPGEVEAEMLAKIAPRYYSFPEGVRVHAVRRQVETWLLADEHAIATVAGKKVSMVRGILEEVQDAKGLLQRVLDAVGLPYLAPIAGAIAREINLTTLRYRCPGFIQFETKCLE